MRSRNTALLLFAVMVAASCSSAPKSSLPDDKHQISEITLERSGSWGMKSGYSVVLRKGGIAEYLGDIHAKRKGKYRGNLSTDQFQQLSKLITANDFFSLEDKYRAPITDTDTITTSVTYSGGRKAVQDFGRGGGGALQRTGISISFIDKVLHKCSCRPAAEAQRWSAGKEGSSEMVCRC